MAERKVPSPGQVTRSGYGIPHEPPGPMITRSRRSTSHPPTPPVPTPPDALHGEVPQLEVAYAHPAAGRRVGGTSTMLEIWTRNRIYFVDTNMLCTDVVHRGSGVSETEHTLRGTKLSGGQRRTGTSVQIVHPFPLVGYEAVFRHGARRPARYGMTSTVERVVLHITRIEGEAHQLQPTWEGLSGG